MGYKSHGITKIDSLGRLVVPKPLRQKNNWVHGTQLEFAQNDQGVFLKLFSQPYTCTICESEKDLVNVMGHYLCTDCVEEAKKGKPVVKDV